MRMGLLDLSIITDHLIKLLNDCIRDSDIWGTEPPVEGAAVGVDPGQSFTIHVSGSAPDAVRDQGGCQLSLYLFHVTQDPYQRNAPVVGDRKRVPPLPYQPLSLDLYYLLSAHARGDYIEEQQAMSIALKCFHEHAVLREVVLSSDGRPHGECCLTMEAETSDAIGRMWQATTVAMRLSVVYKVSVVFIEPAYDDRPVAPKPQMIGLTVDPSALPFAASGQLIGTARHVRYIGPDDVPANANERDFRDYDLMPAVVAPGEPFLLYGAELQTMSPQPLKEVKLFLLSSGQPDLPVTGWIDGDRTNLTPTRLRLNLPDPAPVPAGVYQLRATIDGASTNATPFSIAARVDRTLDPPVFPYAGAPLSLTGAGFIPKRTELLLETVPLEENAAGPGKFAIGVGGTSIQFQPPDGFPSGRYGIRVRVNQVESAPAMWVQIP